MLIRVIAALLAAAGLGMLVGILVLSRAPDPPMQQASAHSTPAPEVAGADPEAGEPIVHEPIRLPEVDGSDVGSQPRSLYDADNWRLEAVTIDGESLVFQEETYNRATFVELLRVWMVEFDVQATSAPGPLEVRLFAPSNGTLVTLVIDFDGVTVYKGRAASGEVLAESNLDEGLRAETPHRCRMVATGNRIVVSWDGVRVLTCDQPAEQSGVPAHIAFVSDGGGAKVTGLRIEGE